ncbi:CHAT domain-containing protein [Microcoleus sp. FACHB-831]|uniref:CHAT domain-containing protein n=1 Tax=Microcoleus sp. FACHB-831 TaxID=2692827 RepID=UPI0016829A4A|nr:CHAT domain-containing protein [Microcoleus sp. FACHB-831]MBD1920304.1 CHAT domain-containing protein [Microcoleus sp. FACHB-831]
MLSLSTRYVVCVSLAASSAVIIFSATKALPQSAQQGTGTTSVPTKPGPKGGRDVKPNISPQNYPQRNGNSAGNNVGIGASNSNLKSIPGFTPITNRFIDPVLLQQIVVERVPRNRLALGSSNEITYEQVGASSRVFPGLVGLRQVQSPTDAKVANLEETSTREFENYLKLPRQSTIQNRANLTDILREIDATTGVKSAFIYVKFRKSSNQDTLTLLLVTPYKQPISIKLDGITRSLALKEVAKLRSEITDIAKTATTSYLPPARQLYEWLIAPLEAELQAQGIKNLVFLMDSDMRCLPVAVLHDGRGFLVQRYSVALMPSVSLSNPRYADIKNTQVLAMGADRFTHQNPLPGVPIELAVITQQLWRGSSFLNEAFTLDNLKSARSQQPFQIIHLATHGEFKPGKPNNSYIQLWDTKLRLDQLRDMGWNNPQVELLVLSACRTAVGDRDAELGFAGLAIQAGVKSALGSLWYVSEEGTLPLMTEFYRHLRVAPIKAQALRLAQLAMIHKQVRILPGQLRSAGVKVSLPSTLARMGEENLSHPYYWAAFTMIGNPW